MLIDIWKMKLVAVYQLQRYKYTGGYIEARMYKNYVLKIKIQINGNILKAIKVIGNNYIKEAGLSKLIFIFNAILIKIPAGFYF